LNHDLEIVEHFLDHELALRSELGLVVIPLDQVECLVSGRDSEDTGEQAKVLCIPSIRAAAPFIAKRYSVEAMLTLIPGEESWTCSPASGLAGRDVPSALSIRDALAWTRGSIQPAIQA
jgi:hypothetical protein